MTPLIVDIFLTHHEFWFLPPLNIRLGRPQAAPSSSTSHSQWPRSPPAEHTHTEKQTEASAQCSSMQRVKHEGAAQGLNQNASYHEEPELVQLLTERFPHTCPQSVIPVAPAHSTRHTAHGTPWGYARPNRTYLHSLHTCTIRCRLD